MGLDGPGDRMSCLFEGGCVGGHASEFFRDILIDRKNLLQSLFHIVFKDKTHIPRFGVPLFCQEGVKLELFFVLNIIRRLGRGCYVQER